MGQAWETLLPLSGVKSRRWRGHVIRAGENRLMERYAFNINGRFYFDDREELQLQGSDRIALLTLATGG